MHPLHALQAGLATGPATATDLAQALPSGEVKAQSTIDNPKAAGVLAKVQELIMAAPSASAYRRDEAGWTIAWSMHEYCLHGILYATVDGAPDKTSPLMLINRFTCQGLYGPQLAEFARQILADTLAYEALQQSRRPR